MHVIANQIIFNGLICNLFLMLSLWVAWCSPTSSTTATTCCGLTWRGSRSSSHTCWPLCTWSSQRLTSASSKFSRSCFKALLLLSFEANLKTVFQYQYWLVESKLYLDCDNSKCPHDKKRNMKMSGSISLKETFIYPSVYEVTNSGRFILILYHTTSEEKNTHKENNVIKEIVPFKFLG